MKVGLSSFLSLSYTTQVAVLWPLPRLRHREGDPARPLPRMLHAWHQSAENSVHVPSSGDAREPLDTAASMSVGGL